MLNFWNILNSVNLCYIKRYGKNSFLTLNRLGKSWLRFYQMRNEYRCPLVNSDIDETMCYDIQMVTGSGSLINKRILDDYSDVFDVKMVTDERALTVCPRCPFNQLKQTA